ncbi:MAG: TlpA family protein disulfide reductase [Bacteroidetes bacterium]|nr:TlpA family protein disulfide reductase [Bacteroidota bacterium]MBS1757817.1 TlpA family protein disulfide reductase [Bacteroidota bacterium]
MKKNLLSLAFFFTQTILVAQIPSAPINSKQIQTEYILSKMKNFDEKIGKPFGGFEGKNISGNVISNKNLTGKVVFVNFWFNSCAPCHDEFDNLNRLYEHYKSDTSFKFISFTFDNPQETIENKKKYNLLFDIIFISNELCHKLIGLNHGFPTNFILDKNGKIAYGTGGIYDTNTLSEIIIPKIDSLLIKSKKQIN